MMKVISAGAFAASVIAAPAAAGQLVKQLTISPGKGVSFFMGSQQGTAIFTQESGACGLRVSFEQAASAGGMSGMSGAMEGMGGMVGKAPVLRMQILPARPARLDMPDGQQLVFNCGPEGKQMFFEMPEGFKYADK